MADGRDLVDEAVNDAKAIKEAALEAAKKELVESMVPAIRSLLEKNIKGALEKDEGVNRMRRADPNKDNWPGESHSGFEEAKSRGEKEMDKPENEGKELDMESLANFFPQVSEEDESGLGQESAVPTLGEEPEIAEAKKDKDDDEELEEEVEISESELKKVYEAALQTEVQVKKGFSDMTKMGEIEDVVKDVDKGLADVKKGEHTWEKEEPPAKQDFTVKEMRQLIQKGLAENRSLRENLGKAVALIKQLGSRLHETNLFNAKVLSVNRILNQNVRLTKEQKLVVMESIDKAKTMDEVKITFEALSRSFNVGSNLAEGKKPLANAQRARTSGGADPKVLRESAEKGDTNGYKRLQELAGLIK